MTTSKLLAPIFGILLAAHGAENVPIDRTMRDFKTPQDFEWKSRPKQRQSNRRPLRRSRQSPACTFKSSSAAPTIGASPTPTTTSASSPLLAGTFKIGTGDKFDKDHTVSLGPGSVVRDIANQMHYDGTGPEGATIQIMGMGPTTRN